MAPAHAIDGPDAHDHATKQLAPELTIDGPQQDGYSRPKRHPRRHDGLPLAVVTVCACAYSAHFKSLSDASGEAMIVSFNSKWQSSARDRWRS
ncbi:hypothetical protein CXR29_03825 [Brevibacterium linens]|nr:hypothetical protein CXR29_03825 [Brevibacterium linens]